MQSFDIRPSGQAPFAELPEEQSCQVGAEEVTSQAKVSLGQAAFADLPKKPSCPSRPDGMPSGAPRSPAQVAVAELSEEQSCSAGTEKSQSGTMGSPGQVAFAEMPKEQSCPGTFLVSSESSPLSESVTMLGGMLAHPHVGIFPYQTGPAPCILAALAKGWGELGCLPTDLVRALNGFQFAGGVDFFWVISDLSAKPFVGADIVNVIHHPWCYPRIEPQATIGVDRHWHAGIFPSSAQPSIGDGLFCKDRTVPVVGSGTNAVMGIRRGNSAPTVSSGEVVAEGAAIGSLRPPAVYVHPGTEGILCCSPNNIRVHPAAPPLTAMWSVCVEERIFRSTQPRGTNTDERPLRACMCLHWLVSDKGLAKNLIEVVDGARSLAEVGAMLSSRLLVDEGVLAEAM